MIMLFAVAALWAAKTAAEAVGFAVLGINAGIAVYAVGQKVAPTKISKTRIPKNR